MQINYYMAHGEHPCFYQFHLASRHFQAACASSSTINELSLQHILSPNSDKQTPSLLERATHLTLAALECSPVGLLVAFIDNFLFNIDPQKPSLIPSEFAPSPPHKRLLPMIGDVSASKLQDVIASAPQFHGYSFGKDLSVKLTDLYIRPANLFFEALGLKTTMPGSGKLFKFMKPLDQVRDFIETAPNEKVISITAKGKQSKVEGKGVVNLEDYLGNNTYRLSIGEIKEMLQSQKVYVSPLISKKFYLALKQAMDKDEMCILPGHDHHPVTLGALSKSAEHPSVQECLNSASKNPSAYGFVNNGKMLSFEALSSLTIYQIGAMIVKTEDYHSFVQDGYEISERNVGDKDQIHLISACGIRGFFRSQHIKGNSNHEIDMLIMKETLKTAMHSIGDGGYFVLPAIGMGVWRGTPEVYWTSFFDAVAQSKIDLSKILVSPGHQTTRNGKYRGYQGEEFGLMLRDYQKRFPDNKNLARVENLYSKKTDVLLCAKKLKLQFPDKIVGLLNASDPDVTLGYHVGEYVNNISHPSTTEENYGAAGSSCLNFEKMTRVLQNGARVIQMI